MIENRSDIKSISEFNEFFENSINEVFNNHFDSLKKEHIKYNIYSKEKKLSIIIEIKYDNLFEQKTKLKVKSVINGYNTDVDEIIEI